MTKLKTSNYSPTASPSPEPLDEFESESESHSITGSPTTTMTPSASEYDNIAIPTADPRDRTSQYQDEEIVKLYHKIQKKKENFKRKS